MLQLLLLQVVGGHGAIGKSAVALRDGMLIVGMLGKSGKLLLTNDGSKKASFLYPRLGNTSMPSNAILLASDPINTPCDTPTTSHAMWHHLRLRRRPFNTCVTKIGLIDPNYSIKEEDGSHMDKGNTSSIAGVLDSPMQSIRTPSVLIDWDDECGSNC